MFLIKTPSEKSEQELQNKPWLLIFGDIDQITLHPNETPFQNYRPLWSALETQIYQKPDEIAPYDGTH